MSRLHWLSRLISASRERFVVDFVRQQSDYYYDFTGEGSNMKVPINQKYMLTAVESAEYFSIGVKQVRKLLQEHPEISIHYGNRWMLIREEAERFFANLPVNNEGRREVL